MISAFFGMNESFDGQQVAEKAIFLFTDLEVGNWKFMNVMKYV